MWCLLYIHKVKKLTPPPPCFFLKDKWNSETQIWPVMTLHLLEENTTNTKRNDNLMDRL
jgi:hypothetical protein